MEGEARVFDRRWRVRRMLRSEMEGAARVFDRRWRVRRRLRSEMEGEGDGFRLERWRVRSKMEGDRALERSMDRLAGVENVSDQIVYIQRIKPRF